MINSISTSPRYILLGEDVDKESITKIIQQILSINDEDDRNQLKYKDYKRTPITLFINTYGGVCYDALALIDIITYSKTPIYTIAIGCCMSAGFSIFVSGHKRFIGPNATLMYHGVSLSPSGLAEDVEHNLKEALRIRERMNNIILNRTNISKKELNKILDSKEDWYIDAYTAIKLHIADDLYLRG